MIVIVLTVGVVMLTVGVVMRMVRIVMNMLVCMLMTFMVVMICIRLVMPGIVGVGVPVFALRVVMMLMIVRLGGLRRFGAFRVDDLALHPLAIAAAA
jgi:hypothetical protein